MKFGSLGCGLGYSSRYDFDMSHMGEYLDMCDLDVYQTTFNIRSRFDKDEIKGLSFQLNEFRKDLIIKIDSKINFADLSKIENNFREIEEYLAFLEYVDIKNVIIPMGLRIGSEDSKVVSEVLNQLENNHQSMKFIVETSDDFDRYGTAAEVLKLCVGKNRVFPCINPSQLNFVMGNYFYRHGSYKQLWRAAKDVLSANQLKNIYVHFCTIKEYEGIPICHGSIDSDFGLRYNTFLDSLLESSVEGIIICDSWNTQFEDASVMKKYYLEKRKGY